MQTEQPTDRVLKEKACDLLASPDPAVKQGIMMLFQFSCMFISYIDVTSKDEYLCSPQRDTDQESLGQQLLSENKMIESKIRHRTYNNRS